MSARQLPSPVLQAGLTLIELLVSLVILGFVVTVMSGAFHQVAQVVRVAESVNGDFQPSWVRLHALNDLVANLVLLEKEEKPFEGDAAEFKGFSLSLPQGNWGTVQPFMVKLVEKKQGQGTELVVAGDDGAAMTMAAWDERMVLEYLAADGTVHSTWPPFGKLAEMMPAGVQVRAAAGRQQVQLVAAYSGLRNPDPQSLVNSLEAVEGLFGVSLRQSAAAAPPSAPAAQGGGGNGGGLVAPGGGAFSPPSGGTLSDGRNAAERLFGVDLP